MLVTLGSSMLLPFCLWVLESWFTLVRMWVGVGEGADRTREGSGCVLL